MKIHYTILILIFIAVYSAFIFFFEVHIDLDIVSELTVASVFFFALFSGFFIARQNDRFTKVVEIISERDGLFSYLYRIFGIAPRIQGEIRETIKSHYTKILESNNWAYNEFNPSDTITRLTRSMASLTEKEAQEIEAINPFDGVWDAILQLQQNRKKIIAAYNERLLLFQWILIWVFAALVILSFAFLQTDLFLVDVLKIVFGTAVFLVVILIKQLNDLSIFGKNFSQRIAGDVLRILEEADMRELREKQS